MSEHIAHQALTKYLTLVDEIGGHLDKKVRANLQPALTAVETAPLATAADIVDPIAVISKALARGADLATDPDVSAALQARQVAELGASIRTQTQADLATTIRDNIDDLVLAAAIPFEEAAATITEAHDVLAPRDINHDTANDVIANAGPDAFTAWHHARTAIASLIRIGNAYTLLFAAAGIEPTGLLYVDPAGAAPMDVLALTGPRSMSRGGRNHALQRPFDLLNIGASLSLTTPLEAELRHAAVAAALEDERAEDTARTEAQRQRVIAASTGLVRIR